MGNDAYGVPRDTCSSQQRCRVSTFPWGIGLIVGLAIENEIPSS